MKYFEKVLFLFSILVVPSLLFGANEAVTVQTIPLGNSNFPLSVNLLPYYLEEHWGQVFTLQSS